MSARESLGMLLVWIGAASMWPPLCAAIFLPNHKVMYLLFAFVGATAIAVCGAMQVFPVQKKRMDKRPHSNMAE